jgi:hypothetical protein
MEEQRRVRVLPGPDPDSLRLLDRETYDPVVVRIDEGDPRLRDVRPGYLLDATLDWSAPEPAVEAVSLRRPTLYTFADDIEPVFEVARDVWQEARASGDGMNSRVTRNTDGEVNGVCYVFAEPPLEDRLAEFRDGTRPLEPLVDRVNETADTAPRDVFVLRPSDGAFVVVTIALEKDGHFAETIRETYGCDRPAESLP